MRVREKRDAYTCAPPHREGRRYGCQQSLSGLRERVACAREREGRMHTRERGAHARARGVFRRSGRRGFTQRTFTSPGPWPLNVALDAHVQLFTAYFGMN